MIVRNDATDPAYMSPEDRITEPAVILATGVLHPHHRAVFAASTNSRIPLDSGQNGIDHSFRPSPGGQRG